MTVALKGGLYPRRISLPAVDSIFFTQIQSFIEIGTPAKRPFGFFSNNSARSKAYCFVTTVKCPGDNLASFKIASTVFLTEIFPVFTPSTYCVIFILATPLKPGLLQ